MRFHCCDPRRLDVLRAQRHGQCHRLPRSARPGGAARRAAPADAVRAPAARRASRLRPTICASPAASASAPSASSGAPPADALPPAGRAGPGRHGRRPAAHAGRSHRQRRRLLDLHAEHRRQFRQRRSARRLRPAALVDRVLVQGRMPVRLRLRRRTPVCPPDVRRSPDIDYLAKDYQGFRRLMLDRLSLLVPGWTERSAADLGVVLVELLAYAADNLSYRQDAIANEAYLATARQRVSVRRHARLVDYFMHEGCNARAFVHFDVVGQDCRAAKRHAAADARAESAAVVAPGSQELRDAHRGRRAGVRDRACRGARRAAATGCPSTPGATMAAACRAAPPRATLRGHLAGLLHVGDILHLRRSGEPDHLRGRGRRPRPSLGGAAHRGHGFERSVRAAVRRAAGRRRRSTSPRSPGIAADALPFPLCLSVEERPGLEVSVALRQHRARRPRPDGRRRAARRGAAGRRLQLARAGAGRLLRQARADRMVPPRFRPALAQAPAVARLRSRRPAGRADQRRRGVVAGKLAAGDRPARARRRASPR